MDTIGEGLEIEPEALRELRDSGADIQLLDVRDDWERDICALTGSLNIPVTRLPNELAQLFPERPVIVLCHFGQRSLQVAAWLRQQGFAEAASVRGGIDAWAIQIDTDMARY